MMVEPTSVPQMHFHKIKEVLTSGLEETLKVSLPFESLVMVSLLKGHVFSHSAPSSERIY